MNHNQTPHVATWPRFVLLICSLALCSQAQTVTTNVSGVLKSEALGTALAKARVTLKSISSDLTYEGTTGLDGSFALNTIKPGTYDVWIELADRIPVKSGRVVVAPGKSQTLSLAIDETTAPFRFRPGVLIDADHLPDPDLAEVIRSLGGLIPHDKWRKFIVDRGQVLDSLVQHIYHYDDAFPQTRAVVTSLVAGVNNLSQNEFLPEGSRVLLPPLPVKPQAVARIDLTQSVLPMAGSVFTAHADSIGSGVSDRGATGEDLATARTWNLDLSASELLDFVSHIPELVRDRLFHSNEVVIAPGLQEIPLHLLAQTTDAASSPISPSPSTWTLPPDVQPTGKYYLLDVYKMKTDGCSHGDMVMEVARQALANYGATRFAANLVQVELDFYSDPSQGRVYIEKYARSLPSDNRDVVLGWLRQLELKAKQSRPQGALMVPVLYLQAINQQLLKGGDADVVSTSFWTQADGHKWLPDDYDSSSTTVILGAVLNNDDSYIESKIYEKTEPLRTFLYGQTRLGVVLVGAERSPGQRFGMASHDGTGVTCLGKGFGWGIPQSCVSRNGGTSFATPHVGSLIMLAEAYWRAQHLQIDALESRVRLLLASDVVPNYVGLYASAGIPVAERLIRKGGTFLVRTNGQLEDVGLGAGSYITYADNGQQTKRLFRRGKSADFSGIQIVDGRVFIFTETSMKWEQVTDTTVNIHVLAKDGHEIRFNSLADLTKEYKGAITLE